MGEFKTFIKYKNVLLLLILAAGFIFSFFFFLKPKILEIFDFRKKINQEKNTLAALTQKVAALNGLDELELERKTEVLLKALPPEKDIVTLLLTFKVLSSQEGVTLKGVKIDPDENAATSLEIEGEQEKIMNFLEKIKTSYPLMKPEDVALSYHKNENLIEGKIVFRTFSQPLPKSLGSIESPLLPITPEEEKSYEEISKFNSVVIEKDLEPVQTGKENPFL